MTSGVFGGGVIFVVAAVLWAAVLVPSWMRRREFKAAEQNALRLQRTLRVLAETAEVPKEVRVEATAREALAQERMLRTAQREQEAERKAKLAEARAAQLRAEMRAQRMKRTQASLVRAAKLRRPWVRRLRSVCALVLLAALVTGLVGVGTLIAGLGFTVLLSGLATFVAALAVLVLLAPGRAKLLDIPEEHVPAASSIDVTDSSRAAAEHQAEDRAAAHAAAQAAAAARMERNRAMARARAQMNRQAQLYNQGDSMLLEAAREQVGAAEGSGEDRAEATARSRVMRSPRLTAPPATSRLQEMGVIGDTSDGALDLDEVLRNRRVG